MKIGRVYIIESPSTNMIYIGSTCRTINQRHREHHAKYNLFLKKQYRYTTSFQIISYADNSCRELEAIILNDDEIDLTRLKQLERKYIDEYQDRAVNKVKPNHKNTLSRCECGGYHSKSSLWLHKRTKRHISYLEKQLEQNQQQNQQQ